MIDDEIRSVFLQKTSPADLQEVSPGRFAGRRSPEVAPDLKLQSQLPQAVLVSNCPEGRIEQGGKDHNGRHGQYGKSPNFETQDPDPAYIIF